MDPRNKARMLKGFDEFSDRIAERYAEARACLESDEYERAYEILCALGISHAKSSLSLRNVLVRDGKIQRG